ncbi:DUF4145 domain-containing protein [Myxococcus stipitatus]|uniref:DUF4145 domain-containing protein n=1 Tax=Myxococcus stipitatus TaxID=83455 RepID=UPI003CD02A8C
MAKGYAGRDVRALIAYCPHCTRPTYFEGLTGLLLPEEHSLTLQVPSVHPGEDLRFLPPEIAPLYDEARRCMSVRAFTATAHLCRKLLINIAVAEGLPPPHNVKFIEAINYLEQHNIIPRNARSVLDRIRVIGNAAAHELPQVTEADAHASLFLTAATLRNLYDVAAVAKAKP